MNHRATQVPPQRRITVQVAYVSGVGEAHLETVSLRAGECVRDAIQHSGLLQRCPEIDLEANRVGIFGTLCTLDTHPKAGDRLEIYRPLCVDPREARRAAAK